MTRVITSPEEYIAGPDDFCIFLAGGISNCPDWQAEAIKEIGEHVDLVIFNPRRQDLVGWEGDEARAQIEWEHRMLMKSWVVVFWFCAETLCPITLFELGKMIGLNKEIIVGANFQYKRLFDIQEQLELMNQGVVETRFDLWIARIKERINSRTNYRTYLNNKIWDDEDLDDRCYPFDMED